MHHTDVAADTSFATNWYLNQPKKNRFCLGRWKPPPMHQCMQCWRLETPGVFDFINSKFWRYPVQKFPLLSQTPRLLRLVHNFLHCRSAHWSVPSVVHCSSPIAYAYSLIVHLPFGLSTKNDCRLLRLSMMIIEQRINNTSSTNNITI